MSKKHKIYTALGTAVYAVLIVLHIIDGNVSAVCGWVCAAVWRVYAERCTINEAAEIKFADHCYDECIRLYGVVDRLGEENAKLRSRIRELETEDVDDGK